MVVPLWCYVDDLSRVGLALEKALKFIGDNRNPDGLWSDFLTLAGESVYWVSGYVGYALSCFGECCGGWLRGVAGSILSLRGGDGGWGYGPGVPSDVDSASWCFRFLSRLGVQGSGSRFETLFFILNHQNLDGGFRTYCSPRDVGRFMRLDEGVSFDGWLSSQLCVTGVVVEALVESGFSDRVGGALELIRRRQSAEGYWESYWWSGELYATVHCMKALRAAGEGEDAEAVRSAQDWIAGAQLDDGSWGGSVEPEGVPFYTALALSGLMVEPRRCFSERVRRGVEWLLNRQMPDGSWMPGYILRIPHPSVKEPWRTSFWKRDGRAVNAVIKDHRRLFSTATVFTALSEFMGNPIEGGDV